MADVLDEVESRFRALQTYQVTMRSSGADGERQVVRYFYRKPGWVRIECVDPHRGVVLVYDPEAHRARVWPLGLGAPALSLAPDNPLIRSPRGHHIDGSDLGALVHNLQVLRGKGGMTPLGEAVIWGQAAIGFEIAAASGISVGGVHRNLVWLARDTLFPMKVQSFGARDELVESVELVDVGLEVCFPERFFTP